MIVGGDGHVMSAVEYEVTFAHVTGDEEPLQVPGPTRGIDRSGDLTSC